MGQVSFLGQRSLLLLILGVFCISGCGVSSTGHSPKWFQPDRNEAYPASSGMTHTVPSEEASGDEGVASRMMALSKQRLEPEETAEVLGTAAENFAYGPGLGETMLDITGVILFPPYAAVLAGNGLLSLTGNEPVRFANLLPDDGKAQYQQVVDGVFSVPGRVVSSAAGEEYRNREEIKQEWERVVAEFEEKRVNRGAHLGPADPSFLPAQSAPVPRFFPAD